MIKRCEKLAFMGVTESNSTVFKRMTKFTELTVSKNPKEYTRKYVDEASERNSVVGYSPSISYKLDYEPTDAVHSAIANIANGEITGDNAVKNIIIVDLSSDNGQGTCSAVKRAFSVIPSSEGDDAETYTLSGSFKASGDIKLGTATSSDSWKTITFTEA